MWRQTEGMTEVRPAATLDAARWLLRSDVDWWDLVRYGPPGFDVYVRIAFAQDPEGVPGEDPALRVALATLATYTATPASGYAAIWEGWGGSRPLKRHECRFLIERCCCSPDPSQHSETRRPWRGTALRRAIRNRTSCGPEDQAWCLACEVDEEVEFTVGCSVDASQALARALPGAVRRVGYGDPAPLYRDPA